MPPFETDPSRNQNKGLHQCPRCDSGLVQPTHWEQADERYKWRLWLRCPECEWGGEGVYREWELDAYDQLLNEGQTELEKALGELVRSNMDAEATEFAELLQKDYILPEDF